MTLYMIISLVVFLGCCVMIAFEKISKIIIALAGAVFFILIRVYQSHGIKDPFIEYIDWNVIFLFIGIMIMIGVIKKTGLFEYIAIYLAKLAKGDPKIIFILLFFSTGIFSAFFDNITTMIFMVQISLLIARELEISALPFIITQLIASTVGGAATLIGDPPNIMVGSAAGISFSEFIVNLSLFVFLCLSIAATLLFLIFRKHLNVSNARRARIMEFHEKELIHDKGLLIYTLIAFALFLTLLLLQEVLMLEVSTIALSTAIIMLLRIKKDEIENFINYEIEWGTILFFCCLFIMVGSLQASEFTTFISGKIITATGDDPKNMSLAILWTSGIGSSFFNNVPFTAALIAMIKNIGEVMTQGVPIEELATALHKVRPLWWALILGASFGGNGTLIATTSNLVVADICNKNKVPFSFLTFTKYGAVITVLNLVLSTGFIVWKYF